LPFSFCLNPDAGLPLPDLTLYLTVPPEVASSRSAYGTERYENLDMQIRTREQFALVAEEVNKRHGPGRWVEISAVGTVDEVETTVWSFVSERLDNDAPLGRLWLE
jgi:dTMP kinase